MDATAWLPEGSATQATPTTTPCLSKRPSNHVPWWPALASTLPRRPTLPCSSQTVLKEEQGRGRDRQHQVPGATATSGRISRVQARWPLVPLDTCGHPGTHTSLPSAAWPCALLSRSRLPGCWGQSGWQELWLQWSALGPVGSAPAVLSSPRGSQKPAVQPVRGHCRLCPAPALSFRHRCCGSGGPPGTRGSQTAHPTPASTRPPARP